MPAYAYVALDALGRRAAGRADSDSPARLRDELRRDGLFLLTAEAETEDRAAETADLPPLPTQVLADLTERLEILLKGGIPLVEALGQLAEDGGDERARAVAADLAAVVGTGRPLGEALARHPRVFDDSYRAAVAAGEHAGALDRVLTTLTQKLNFRSETRKQIRGALAYPAGLLVALVGLMTLVLIVLIPKMMTVFDKARATPPAITVALIGAKDFLAAQWPVLLGVAAAGAIAFRVGMRYRGFRGAVQEAVYRIPFVGDLQLMSETAAFVGVVGLLHRYGVNLTKALEIAGRAVRTERLKRGVETALAGVMRGEGLAESMRAAKAFPPLVVQMTAVGQKSGGLEDAFGRVESYLDREIPRTAKKLVGVVSPTVTILAGLTVGLAVYSVMAPLMSVMQALKGGGR